MFIQNKHPALDEELKIEGWWCLPANGDTQIKGTLTYNPSERPLLSLDQFIAMKLWHSNENFLMIGESLNK